MEKFVTILNLTLFDSFLWHDYNGLAAFERELLKYFFNFYGNLSCEFVYNEWAAKTFFIGEWKLSEKRLCRSRLQPMKGRSAMNVWNIQLCCWQSVTSRNETIAERVFVAAAYFRSVYSSFSDARAIKISFVEKSIQE